MEKNVGATGPVKLPSASEAVRNEQDLVWMYSRFINGLIFQQFMVID